MHEVEKGFAHHLGLGPAQHVRPARIELEETAFAGDHAVKIERVFEEAVVGEQFALAFRQRSFIAQRDDARTGDVGQLAQLDEGRGFDMVGLRIDRAQRAEHLRLGNPQRHPNVEAHVRSAGDQWVAREARVLVGVLHHQFMPAAHDRVAEGDIARGFLGIEADAGLEPLAVVIEQRDEADGHTDEAARHPHDAVKHRIGRRVHDRVRSQHPKALGFLRRRRPFEGFLLLRHGTSLAPAPNRACRTFSIAHD